jgi:putative intracellular protease/amidase
MKKRVLFLHLLFVCSSYFCQDGLRPKKILIVGTNIDKVGRSDNGSFLWEIAYPFQYFIDQGYDVDILTPKGGQAAIYPKEYAGPGIGKIQRSELFISKTNKSLAPDLLRDTDYVAVFYPGGYGQFFDIVKDENISNITTRIYEKGGIIGTSGHGTASLVNIKLSTEHYLVEGKKMTCFPHWMEISKMFESDYGKLLPFDMQKLLAERGALLTICTQGSKTTKECSQVSDATNRMVTGAFANDAQWVAEEMVRLLRSVKK